MQERFAKFLRPDWRGGRIIISKPLIFLNLYGTRACCPASFYEFQVFNLKFSLMPTVLSINGYRFFFYSNENNEPAHVHMEKGDAEGKVWLEPAISVAYFKGFKTREQNEIMQIVGENFPVLIKKWYEHFGK